MIPPRGLALAGLLASALGCKGSHSAKPGDPPPAADCPQVTTLSNGCLEAEALSLYQAESAEILVEKMASLTVTCKPSREEFKELLCQYNQNKK